MCPSTTIRACEFPGTNLGVCNPKDIGIANQAFVAGVVKVLLKQADKCLRGGQRLTWLKCLIIVATRNWALTAPFDVGVFVNPDLSLIEERSLLLRSRSKP